MPMGCFYRHPYIHICICHRCIHVVDDDVLYVWDRDNYINSSAWVSRCSFNYFGQCEKPQSVGRATGTDLHAFLYSSINKSFIYTETGRSIGIYSNSYEREERKGGTPVSERVLQKSSQRRIAHSWRYRPGWYTCYYEGCGRISYGMPLWL